MRRKTFRGLYTCRSIIHGGGYADVYIRRRSTGDTSGRYASFHHGTGRNRLLHSGRARGKFAENYQTLMGLAARQAVREHIHYGAHGHKFLRPQTIIRT